MQLMDEQTASWCCREQALQFPMGHPTASAMCHAPCKGRSLGLKAWVEAYRSELSSRWTLTLCRGNTHLCPFRCTVLLLPRRSGILLSSAQWGKEFSAQGLSSVTFHDPAKAPKPVSVQGAYLGQDAAGDLSL